jgi:DNA-binding SARP family transcriptional activator/tetratricopeptide (TPR) repeat protein
VGLRIEVLGPLMVSGSRWPDPPLSSGQAAVLGLLALAGGSPVQVDWLIDALWGQDPPASAMGIIYTHVSRLRSVLDQLVGTGGKSMLTRDRAGYRLAAGTDQLDLLAFRDLIAAAQLARNGGNAREACESYDRALGLVRGDPLCDVQALRDHPAVIALRQECAVAALDFADLADANGWHGKALPHLQALAARDRLNEAVQARLMMALAGCGRQAEALRLYEDMRHLLDAELGVEPSEVLRDAHARILRQDFPSDGERRLGLGVAGGWQPVFQLPPAPGDFTGRTAETARLTGELRPAADRTGVPLAVISGMPGIGKTSLALHVAHSMRAQFPDGQLWAHLAGTSARPRDAGEILGEFLRALGLPGSEIPPGLAERAGCYRSRLAGRRVLVVADDAAAEQVRPLMPGTPGNALLVTSRFRLGNLDGALHLPLDVMPAADAVSMLARIVGTDRVATEHDAAVSLIQACGALPLAVRIAGAKLAIRSSWCISGMARRLKETQGRLGELQADDLSVPASIAASYWLLPKRHRRAFRLLALLGATDFAAWVVGALLGETEAADVVDQLEARSILTALGPDATGEPRYRLHDLIRDFAAERLAESGEEAAPALERLHDAWLQLAAAADAKLPPELYFPPQPSRPTRQVVPPAAASRLTSDAIAWFTAERINLLTAVERACAAGEISLARCLAGHQCAFQHLQRRQDDTEQNWRVIASYAERSDDQAEAAAYARVRVAAAMQMSGLSAQAIPVLEGCPGSAATPADAVTEALSWYMRGLCRLDLNKFAAARDHAERGIAVARLAGSKHAEFLNQRLLALALAWTGDGEAAIAAGKQALAIVPAHLALECELAALHTMAHTYWLAGRSDQATWACLQAIHLSRRLGDTFGEAMALGYLSDAYRELGWYEESAGCLLRALPVFAKTSQRRFQALCLLKLGYSYAAIGCTPEAIAHLEDSIIMFRQLQVPAKIDEAQAALDRCRAAAAEQALGQVPAGMRRRPVMDMTRHHLIRVSPRAARRPGRTPLTTHVAFIEYSVR